MLKCFFFITCLLLTSCMVGPDYKEPAKPITQHWKKQNASVNEKPFKEALWWKVFNDPLLTQLIERGYASNPSLISMGVNILQARAQLAQSVGELYPQQQALIGNYNYNRIGGSQLQRVLPNTFDTAMLGFTANWELDFWGKYRRAIQSTMPLF